MCRILTNIRDGNTDLNQLESLLGLESDDYQDALKRLIDLNLITGVMYTKTIGGLVFNVHKPRLTYEGLAFIESHENQ
ncbi:YjcQ family protein [Alicyclobacillus macrosporangiidus]